MKTDDRARTELHERLDDTLGHNAADTLMGYLPPVGWADVATKQDLRSLESSIQRDIAELRVEFEKALRLTITAIVMAVIGSVGAAVALTQWLTRGP
jgi:hypothetical protein